MSRSWSTGDHQSVAFLPVDARDWLPADHAAFQFLALVDEFDVSEFESAYREDGVGQTPFDPRAMLALVLYCRSKRLMSGRAIMKACHDDLGARVITGNQQPDRSTIDRFLVNHAAAIKRLLVQTLRLGHAEGLVDVSTVAGDGTKITANAAMGATVGEVDLLAQIVDLQAKLAVLQALWEQQVGAEVHTRQPTLFIGAGEGVVPGGGVGSTAVERKIRQLAGILHSRQAALSHLREHPDTAVKDWTERLTRDQQRVQRHTENLEKYYTAAAVRYQSYQQAKASGGKLSRGKPPPLPEDHIRVRQTRKALAIATARAEATATQRPTTGKVNTTDPTSRIMPGKHDGFDQRYNVQAIACKNQFVIEIGTHDSSNDKQALISLLHNARTNLDDADITDPIGTALFDNGYASVDNFTADLPVTQLLIAVKKEGRQTGRIHDDNPTTIAAWQNMAERLDDPANRKIYKLRAAIIEPLFAQLFARFGRTLNPRGEQVDTEIHLWAITHNLLKISRSRQRSRQPG